MDMKEFSQMNLIRCEAPDGFNHRINDWSSSDWMTATMGELGEAANIVKKLNRSRDGIRGNKESDDMLKAKLVTELADTFIYLDLFMQSLRHKTDKVIMQVFNQKSKEKGMPYFIGNERSPFLG